MEQCSPLVADYGLLLPAVSATATLLVYSPSLADRVAAADKRASHALHHRSVRISVVTMAT